MKTKIRLVLEVLITLVAFLGVLIDMSGQRSLLSAFKLLNFFTIQSNILVFVIMLLVVLNRFSRRSQPTYLVFLSGGASLWIILTGVIFHFMLSGIYKPDGIQIISNMILHYVTPTLMAIYYFGFIDKKVINMKYPLLWALYPIIYGLGCVIRGLFDGFYPYWFFNPTGSFPDGAGSYPTVLMYVFGLGFVFLVFGYIIVVLKKLIIRLF